MLVSVDRWSTDSTLSIDSFRKKHTKIARKRRLPSTDDRRSPANFTLPRASSLLTYHNSTTTSTCPLQQEVRKVWLLLQSVLRSRVPHPERDTKETVKPLRGTWSNQKTRFNLRARQRNTRAPLFQVCFAHMLLWCHTCACFTFPRLLDTLLCVWSRLVVVCMCICVFIEWWAQRLSRSTHANCRSTIDSVWTKSDVDRRLVDDVDRRSTGRTSWLDGFFVCKCFTNVFVQRGHYSIKQETQWAPCTARLPWSWDCFALQWSKVLTPHHTTPHHSNHTTTYTITIITDWLHWKQLGIRSVLQWWTIPTLKPALLTSTKHWVLLKESKWRLTSQIKMSLSEVVCVNCLIVL